MKARFHPQAWVDDYAIDVDPEGPTEWDVGAVSETMKDDTYDPDRWREHPNTPAWVREWAGPFWIEVDLPDPTEDAFAVVAERVVDGMDLRDLAEGYAMYLTANYLTDHPLFWRDWLYTSDAEDRLPRSVYEELERKMLAAEKENNHV